MDGTIIGQGVFRTPGSNTTNNTVANGNQMIVQIPSGADWMVVTDYSQWAAAGTNTATFQGVANGSTAFRWTWHASWPSIR